MIEITATQIPNELKHKKIISGYDPLNPSLPDDEIFAEDYLDKKQDGTFTIGQSYIKDPCPTFYCKRCNGNTFHVGRIEYFTAIKCVNCNYEICVHEG